MPSELGQNNFQSGWIPSDDFTSGRKDGLLRMDNCFLDENGCVSLMRGTAKLTATPFAQYVNKIYSVIANGTKTRYISEGGRIWRSKLTDFSDRVTITGLADPNHAFFATGFGQVMASAGLAGVLRDDGTNVWQMGFPGPQKGPYINISQPNSISLAGTYSGWTLIEGANLIKGADYVQADAAGGTFRAAVQDLYSNPINAASIPLYGGGGTTPMTDGDTFKISVRIGDSTLVSKVRVELILAFPDATVNDVSDYFYFEWPAENSTSIRDGINQWSTLQCERKDFIRMGNDPTVGWQQILGIKVIFEGTAVTTYVVSDITIFGGQAGPLTGTYEWCAIWVNNNGVYQSKSPPGPSYAQVLTSGSAKLGMETDVGDGPPDSQVNEVWYFRRGGGLDQFYRVGVVTKAQANSFWNFTDTMSDTTALQIGITLNPFIVGVRYIPDEVLGIEGPYFERMLYMTFRNIYLSDRMDPDVYDQRTVITTASNVGEMNLWIKRVSMTTILLGTTQDIYEISGTLILLPDGTIDYTIKPLGLQPPITRFAELRNNQLFYFASDGPRFIQGYASSLIDSNLDLLLKGQTRYGVAGILTTAGGVLNVQMAYVKNKLWMIVYHSDTSSSVLIRDFARSVWTRFYSNPACLCVEEDGTLLAGYTDGHVRQLDIGTKIDGSQKLNLFLSSALTPGEMPLQRKDAYSLKIFMDTQGDPVNLYVTSDVGAVLVSSTASSIGLNQLVFPLHGTSVDLKRFYGIQIFDSGGVSAFKLISWSIDFDPRPIPVPYLRIPPTNLGTIARKRMISFAYNIDTLGKQVLFMPQCDNQFLVGDTYVTNDKTTIIHYFRPSVELTDIGGYLYSPTGELFEPYGIDYAGTVSETMPPRATYLVVPESNFGVAARKRMRTIPLVINTFGHNVNWTPTVDALPDTANISIIKTNQKETALTYFRNDSFGIDYGGVLETSDGTPFEFYEMAKPEDVEILPVEKLLDQIGPWQEDRIGKFLEFRLRAMFTGSSATYKVFVDDLETVTDTFSTFPNTDTVYQIKMPRFVNGRVFRIEISSDAPFHRWFCQVRMLVSGMQTENKWETVSAAAMSLSQNGR